MLRKYGMKIECNLELVLLDEWNARWLYEFEQNRFSCAKNVQLA
jgi:hypothetical protein